MLVARRKYTFRIFGGADLDVLQQNENIDEAEQGDDLCDRTRDDIQLYAVKIRFGFAHKVLRQGVNTNWRQYGI